MAHVLLAVNDPATDPRARARLGSLVRVGHRPVVVAVGTTSGDEYLNIGGIDLDVRRLVRGAPGLAGRFRPLLDHVLPGAILRGLTVRQVVDVVGATPCLHVVDARALPLAASVARRAGGVVLADPRHEVLADAAWRVPHDPGDAGTGGPGGPRRHVPDDDAAWEPADGRHHGRRVALCVRRTERTPGRYLEAALRRAGVHVLELQDRIDWADLPRDLDAVLVVESPLPAPSVHGENPGIPLLFWVHHGEHHVDQNVRLAQRYGADVVLLAHSWHLAHRFAARVERFPFAVAPELGVQDAPPSTRRTDVAFVGSGLQEGAGGDAYDARRALVAGLRAALGRDRVVAVSGVSPQEVVALYADSRVVPNEGGRRHRPITMRVFEAIGAGAVLASERVPGLDLLLAPDDEYVQLGADQVADVVGLLDTPGRLDAISAAAGARWQSRHTYDHRVDELFFCLDELPTGPAPAAGQGLPAPAGLAGVVDNDPEVQRLVTTNGMLAEQLPDREVWTLERARWGPRAYEALVVDGSFPELPDAVASVWRYVYATDAVVDEVTRAAEATHPRVTRTRREQDGVVVHRFDLHPASYRVR